MEREIGSCNNDLTIKKTVEAKEALKIEPPAIVSDEKIAKIGAINPKAEKTVKSDNIITLIKLFTVKCFFSIQNIKSRLCCIQQSLTTLTYNSPCLGIPVDR